MTLEIEDRQSDSPYVARVWRSRSSGVDRMTSVATSHWEFVVWTHRGIVNAAIRGPETAATVAAVPDDSDSVGIVFSYGTSMPHLPMPRLVDAELECPRVTHRGLTLGGEDWPLPGFNHAEQFAARLARAGVLVRDPLVEEVVEGATPSLGTRSVQRRVATATGLTRGAIRQIERARQATILLRQGVAPLDVVHRLDYYDQPHLARSLKRFIGRTAKQLRHSDTEPLSLLYKTDT